MTRKAGLGRTSRFIVMQDLKTIRFERFSVQPPTGPDGRFRISGLVPGVFTLSMPSGPAQSRSPKTTRNAASGSIGKPGWTVKAGETQDWGDVHVKTVRALTKLVVPISANRLRLLVHLLAASIENRGSRSSRRGMVSWEEDHKPVSDKDSPEGQPSLPTSWRQSLSL